MDVQNSIFEEYYKKLMLITKKTDNENTLMEILTKLNNLNYSEKIPFITTWTCTDLLLHLISLLKEFGKDERFLALLCELIVKVASKQRVVICSMSVNVILHGLKDIWFEILAYFNVANISKEVCCHLLSAIAAVVYGNGAYIMPNILNWITGKDAKSGNIKELLLSPVAIDIKILCLQCLSGLCITSESRERLDDAYLYHCLQLFIDMLQNFPPVKDVSHYRAIFAAHKGLQYILEGPGEIYIDEIGPLLAVLKKYLVFGLPAPAHELPNVLVPMQLPAAINPDTISVASREAGGSGKKRKKRNRRKGTDRSKPLRSSQDGKEGVHSSNAPDDSQAAATFSLQADAEKSAGLRLSVTSSESEYSDTEGGQLSAMNSLALKIRQLAIGSLYAKVKKTSKVVMLGYWNSFISSTMSSKDISLLSCILNDPAPKARVSVLMVLSALLDGSKVFLSLGIQKGDSSAFVSFSSSLTSYVHNIHNTLLKALTKERSTLVQVHLLKTLGILAANTPYAKISSGFITNIFVKVKAIMAFSYDWDTKIGVLNVYSAIVGYDPALPEIRNCIANLTAEVAETAQSGLQNGSSNGTPSEVKSWIVEDCLVFLNKSANLPLPLHVAIFQLLTAVTKMYFSVIFDKYFAEIVPQMCLFICDSNPTIRLHASKLTEEFGASLLRNQKTDKSVAEKALLFWKQLLSGAVQKIVENIDDSSSKSYVCNCLSTIGPTVLEMLPERQQVYCQTLLLGLTNDESYVVRSAAIRALARFIMFPQLRKDVGFVDDVAQCILQLMNDPTIVVQFNAAWSFGNFTDAIIINIENEPQSFSRDMLRKSFLLDLLKCAIDASDRKEKIRFNMMRVLGNILRFCNESHFEDERFRNCVLEAKAIMVNAILRDSLMKVRWNACLACGNMLRNAHLLSDEPEWTNDVYDALCATVSSMKHYKVSIKAAVALGCPLTREVFGARFLPVYLCVLRSLQSSETNEVGIAEYKFKDQLQEQLICTLLRLTTFIIPSDLQSIIACNTDEQLFDFVRSKLNKWYNTLFIEHKLSTLSIENQNVDTYAALGQFAVKQKKDMFHKACEHWQSTLKRALDVPGKEKPLPSHAAQYKELFSLDSKPDFYRS